MSSPAERRRPISATLVNGHVMHDSMLWFIARQKDSVAPLVSMHTENAGGGHLPSSILTVVYHVHMYAEMSQS